MSAIKNPRPSSTLTRAERMAAFYATRPVVPAPLFKVGDDVIFRGRASKVTDVKRSSSGAVFVIVANYAGGWMISETHSELGAA